MSLWDWPALGGTQPSDFSAVCGRGIYSKVDNAATDFRWIGVSQGFTQSRKELHARFAWQTSEPGVALWWSLENRYYASFSYWSRGRDSASRPYLETQILEWNPDGLPVALAALALLLTVARSNDEETMEASRSANWKNEAYQLLLSPFEVQVTANEMEQFAEKGLAFLRKLKGLKEFYLGLVSSRTPAMLAGIGEPLPPEALAALLLPGKPAETWSVAAWPTASLEHWNGVAGKAPSAPVSQEVVARPEQDRATMMALAVQESSPCLAARPCPEVGEILAFARNMDERWVEWNRLPESGVTLIEPEIDLLAAAWVNTETTEPPAWLLNQPEQVVDGFKRQMEMKAEIILAWQWVLDPKDQPLTPSTRTILAQWAQSPLVRARTKAFPQADGATPSKMG